MLRARMTERGSQARLSEQSGIPSPVLGRWRDGVGRPTDTNLKKLAPALGVPYEDLAKMCGYMNGRANPVSSEMDAHLARYGAVLSRYPRTIWLAVIEANEAMAAALAQIVPPVSDSQTGGVIDQNDEKTRDDHDSDGGLTVLYPGLSVSPRRAVLAGV